MVKIVKLCFGALYLGFSVAHKASGQNSTSLVTHTQWSTHVVSVEDCDCTKTKLHKIVETSSTVIEAVPAATETPQETCGVAAAKEDSPKDLFSPLQIVPDGANIVYQEWNLTETSVNPDGRYRRGFLINGQSPGPLINGNQGDWVVIKVNNYLTVPITVHFHGIHQRGTVFSDGVPGVTQYPILSGDSYVYVWKMEQYGFYWYHSHFRGYQNDGIVGPIYILPSNDVARPYSKVTENADLLVELEKKPNYLLLGDWFKDPYDDIAVKMFAFGMDPTCVQSMLINGKGRHYCLPQETILNEGANKYEAFKAVSGLDNWSIDQFGCMDLQVLNGFTSIEYDKSLLEFPGHNTNCFNTTAVEQEIFWTEGKDYVYFNILNTGGLFSKTLSIDDHKITVVAIDGTFVEPQTVEQLYLPIGLRLSVVVETKASEHAGTSEPFAIRAEGADMPQIFTALAYLQYGSFSNDTYNHIQSNVTIDTVHGVKHNNLGGVLLDESYQKLDPFASSPLDKALKPPTGPADVTILAHLQRPGATTFTVFDETLGGGIELGFPILFKLQENSTVNATDAFGGAVVDAGIKEGDVVDIIFQNTPLADHPMHLHGHTFWVLAKNDTIGDFGYNTTQQAIDAGHGDLFNFDDPAYLDNVAIMVGGYAVVRFVATNSIAMLHCHITTHLAMGMGGVLVEDKAKLDAVPPGLLAQGHADYDARHERVPSETK